MASEGQGRTFFKTRFHQKLTKSISDIITKADRQLAGPRAAAAFKVIVLYSDDPYVLTNPEVDRSAPPENRIERAIQSFTESKPETNADAIVVIGNCQGLPIAHGHMWNAWPTRKGGLPACVPEMFRDLNRL